MAKEMARWQEESGGQTARHNEPHLKCIIRCSRHLCGENAASVPLPFIPLDPIHCAPLFSLFPQPLFHFFRPSSHSAELWVTIETQNTHTQSSFLSFLMVIPYQLPAIHPSLSISLGAQDLSLSFPLTSHLSLLNLLGFFFWWWSCCCRIIIAIRVRLN